MGRLAFVFSGQGDQHTGMGREMAAANAAAARVFAACDAVRPGTSAQCFGGSEEELKKTVNTQPCLFAFELAAAEALKEKGLRPDAAAGFSLGEVAAVTFAGALPLETGMRLICRRGELMQREAERRETAMAAVLRLERAQLAEICAALSEVYPVNFNCPGQIVAAGPAGEMEKLKAAVQSAGGRVIPLKVGGGFHSPFMRAAASDLAEELRRVPFQRTEMELYSNLTAELYHGNYAEMLSRQIMSPVLWEQEVRNMIDDGIDTFVEVGPGSTLAGMIRRIDRNVRVCTAAEILSKKEEVQTC